jgi:hypothetical protein
LVERAHGSRSVPVIGNSSQICRRVPDHLGTVLFSSFYIWQTRRTYRLRKIALRLLRRHPLLGALGTWRLKVNREEFVVETPGGRQSFSRASTPISAFEHSDVVLWFDGLPIVIPENDAAAADKAQRLRVWLLKTAH